MKVNMVRAKTERYGHLTTGTLFKFVKTTDKYPDGVYIKTNIKPVEDNHFFGYAVNIHTGKSIQMSFDKECIPLKVDTTVELKEGFDEPTTDCIETNLNVAKRDINIPVVDVTTDKYLKWVYDMTIRRGFIEHSMSRRGKVTENDINNARNLVNFYTLVANVCDEHDGMIQNGEKSGGYYGGKIRFKLHDHYFTICKGEGYACVNWDSFGGKRPICDDDMPILDWEE